MALGALAHESRIGIYRLLVVAGPNGLAAGEIGRRLELPQTTLSFHLSQMRNTRLITSRRKSRSIIYSANYQQMNALLIYLTRNCCQGRTEVCGPLVEALADCGL